MLDRQLEMMLQVAATLTAEDMDTLRGDAVARPNPRTTAVIENQPAAVQATCNNVAAAETATAEPAEVQAQTTHHPVRPTHGSAQPSTSNLPRGEYERQRTRESKISTACVGREREKHDWWPVGTELVGHMDSESFTAMVVENAQVKSGRSILITSGAASGKVCMTPTRAAIEATEDYRKADNLGRGGGVTNGWEFWQPRT